ncbi:DUF7931 domain-containing protein [Derxia lacustris]|uniref:DUF7931 domain-containing protein n=1 Tax=Derxia lacustris TaxID=764842 RepID=UPI00111BCF50|nr:hypothetical protein [Derxia lacustris]
MNAAQSPSLRAFEQRSDFHAALFELIRHAEKELLLFDPDFQAWPASEARFSEALGQFLARGRSARLRLATGSPAHLLRNCPRLVSLFSRHSDQIQSVHASEMRRLPAESLLIADRRHALRLPDFTRPRGVLRLDDLAYAQPLADRFEEIWQLCEARIHVNPLGL